MKISSWMMVKAAEPLVRQDREDTPGPDEVMVKVAGCGVCHTDLGFLFDGVPTRHPLPLALGHEVSGTVVEAGGNASSWMGKKVVVPAVIPCGSCPACQDGKGSICPKQIFPGNDDHGGFGSHLKVPALGLCPVPDLEDAATNPEGLALADLSVLADAVSTPYQAVKRSGLAEGDLAVVIGVGGVGGFGAQIAAAQGAQVVAIDVSTEKLELARAHGAALALHAGEIPFKELKKQIKQFAGDHGIPTWKQNIFECSGTPSGQSTAFGLLGHGSHLSVVGYTPKKVELRLSNLMALDATAQGNWGCLPEFYPAALELVLSGQVKLKPFIECRPLEEINSILESLHAGPALRRMILVPEK